MPRFVLKMFAGLKMFRDIASLSTDVRIQNCVIDEGQRALVEIDRPNFPGLSVSGIYSDRRWCTSFVDLTNDREEIVPFNVHDATSILEFSSSQMFSMPFRDSLGTTETERNALVLEDI
uniref:Uncharacterized protein n=1 Tax=Brassica oleracea TaxID=3712 RepID=A0A3P6F928_BRAOL|nr:unnamed protein product [Brassica oleracea]